MFFLKIIIDKKRSVYCTILILFANKSQDLSAFELIWSYTHQKGHIRDICVLFSYFYIILSYLIVRTLLKCSFYSYKNYFFILNHLLSTHKVASYPKMK